MVGNWIIGENLRPLAEVLSWEVGYDFDHLDWGAISTLLNSTDEAYGRWADYRLSGLKGVVNLRFAWTDRDNEGTLVSVEVESSGEVEAVALAATSVMQSYYLRPDFPQ